MKKQSLQSRIADQRKWIEEHGGNEYGYVQRYGSKHDDKHYGDGGEAIFKADHDALMRLLTQETRKRK